MPQNPSLSDDGLLLEVRKRAVTRRAWEALYRRFKELEANGFSQADFARALNKAPAQISRVLSRPRNMTLESYAELAHGLNAYPIIELRVPHSGNISAVQATIVKLGAGDEEASASAPSTPPAPILRVDARQLEAVDA
jgi:transcriptional regulator with XRE-family HTH domain